ncbi:MAG: imidazole glycerol phosphate synthase subunit HisH [Eggerthellaceae bacterium]|nr:imidazole glycerol phosphate synthase subunit HisH [Eggerthellaceae bacterium]
MPLIALVDYGLEDLSLIETALNEAGAEVFPSSDPDAIVGADGIVLYGKAGFAEAIEAIREKDLEQHLKAAIVANKPFLGINVGMHLLYGTGRESTASQLGERFVKGINFIVGSCRDLPDVDEYGFDFELPHKGMAPLYRDKRCKTKLLDNIEDGQEFYYEHSFIAPTGPLVQAWSSYSMLFPAAVSFHDHYMGVQFLPEQSGEAGMTVLRNFVMICASADEVEDLKFQLGPAF